MIIFIKCFILSILLHIIDDFVLQPICLSKLKQKQWWVLQVNYNDDYKNDYIVALIIHGLSWAIMVALPLLFYLFKIEDVIILFFWIIINALLHSWIDNLKANKKAINLLFDQLMHFGQIISLYLNFLIF